MEKKTDDFYEDGPRDPNEPVPPRMKNLADRVRRPVPIPMDKTADEFHDVARKMEDYSDEDDE